MTTYLNVAWRNLTKHKLFSLINIGGLGVSLASCIFIFYFIFDEVTYDYHHKNGERIYRLTQTFITLENTQNIRWTHQKIGPFLKRIYPQVEDFVRMEDVRAQMGRDKILEKGVVKADRSILEIFSFPLVMGDVQTALLKPGSIVLSEALADKYFHGDAMGRSLLINGEWLEVTAIMEDVPSNTDKWISAIISEDFPGEEAEQQYYVYDTYILLKSSQDSEFIKSKLNDASAVFQHGSAQELKTSFDMQPLRGLHFYHGVEMDNPKGNITHVLILAAVAVALLLVALINFINLTTVRSLERAKEVGIRKVAGAHRSQLVRQFVAEAFVSIALASIVATISLTSFRIVFQQVSGKTLQVSSHSTMIIAILGLMVMVALLASFYPSWILSKYKPASVLRGRFSSGEGGGSTIRKIFTTAQFALSTALLVFLTINLLQMKFMRSTDLGFSKEKILAVKAPEEDSTLAQNIEYIKHEWLQNKSVLGVSVGGFASNLGTREPFASPLWMSDEGQEKRQLIVPNITVDKTYPSMLALKIVQGQSFSDLREHHAKGKALVNEAFVRLAGWKDPIGKKVRTYSGEGVVVGVVKDFHFQSLHHAIEPMAILGMDDQRPDVRYFFLKTTPSALNDLHVTWNKLFPNETMEYFFLDDFFNEQYRADENLQTVFWYFTILTIVVSASGLLGLTLYQVTLKTKEIGIRKILGAGTGSLIVQLSQHFMKLVFTGTVIGIFAGSWFSHKWLANFSYQVPLNFLSYLFPAVLLLILGLLIVVSKTYQGATKNPVDNLRQE
jgi:putative ABC transport system permease protein